MENPLVDAHGRQMRKLRLQLTDACNFRCFYCMPEDARFLPHKTLLTPDEIEAIVAALAAYGLREVRLTGGEPTIRPEFDEIVARLGRLGLAKLALTTNGVRLQEKLDVLAAHGLTHVNVSLDSLRPERFATITRTPHFARVYDGILAAKARGFHVKINVVSARYANDDELEDYVRFSEEHGIPVRFLELMRIGPKHAEHAALFVPAAELIEKLQTLRGLTPVVARRDATAFSYRTERGGEIGFIASESRPFCGDCSRLRLSATGWLRACLFSEAGLPLRGVPTARYPEILAQVIGMKPTGRIAHIDQAMHGIGG